VVADVACSNATVRDSARRWSRRDTGADPWSPVALDRDVERDRPRRIATCTTPRVGSARVSATWNIR